MICDLCNKRKATSPHRLLCDSCQEAVARLMLVARWEVERKADRERNKLQIAMCIAYLQAQAATFPGKERGNRGAAA